MGSRSVKYVSGREKQLTTGSGNFVHRVNGEELIVLNDWNIPSAVHG